MKSISEKPSKISSVPRHFDTYAQNFYVLKIHLNLFEISNRVLKFENWIQIWKFSISSEILFQTWTLRSDFMCMYSTSSHDKLEYMLMAPLRRVHVWKNFKKGYNFFRFKSNIQIQKRDLRFQINSNGFSRHRSFGH